MNYFFSFIKQYFLLFFILLFPFVTAADSKGAGGFEIDEEASARALERSLVQSGGLLLGTGKLDVQVGMGFSRTENDVLLSSINDNSTIGQRKNMRTAVNMPINIRTGLPYDTQVDVSIPLNYVDQQFVDAVGLNAPVETSRSGAGIGDINIRVSKALGREKGWKPDVIGFFSWDADNGKRSDNNVSLGGGFNEFSGGFTLTKSQDPLVFSTSISAQVTAEKDDIKPGDQLNFSLAAFLAASPKTSLRFSLDQSFSDNTEVNGREVIDSEKTIALLNIGISSVITPSTFLSFSAGAGLTDDSPDYVVGISLSERSNLFSK